MRQLIQLSGKLSHLSGDLALLLAQLVPLSPEFVPFLTDLPDLGDLCLVMGHPRLDVLEALYASSRSLIRRSRSALRSRQTSWAP
ncbi:hypothetical protein PF003_g16671 [Phytophthora fragariae]|nr:hypothetical protein PF003_g16671 [Phytophthora fragariae]